MANKSKTDRYYLVSIHGTEPAGPFDSIADACAEVNCYMEENSLSCGEVILTKCIRGKFVTGKTTFVPE